MAQNHRPTTIFPEETVTVFETEVLFDSVCAWCYIAKRQQDHAISLFKRTYPGGKHDVFSITWRPYYLDCDPHPHSVDKSALSETKLADMPARAARRAGEADGADRPLRRGRLQVGREGAGVQGALVEGLFEAYHKLEKDISEREVLRGVAVAVGIDAGEVEELLDSAAGVDQIGEEEKKAREVADGSGVPTVVIQGVHRLEDAQNASDIYEAFLKVKEADAGTE